jgi:hypothetical protein
MKTKMTRMNTYPQFSFLIKLYLRMELITPFQLVNGLHPLLLMEYMLPSKPRHNYDSTHVKVLTSRLL